MIELYVPERRDDVATAGAPHSAVQVKAQKTEAQLVSRSAVYMVRDRRQCAVDDHVRLVRDQDAKLLSWRKRSCHDART